MAKPPLDALNALFAMPWGDLVAQYAGDAHAGELHGWTSGSGDQRVADVLHYNIGMGVVDAGWSLSAANAPGYAQVADDALSVAAPLEGTWRATLGATLTARFHVWVDAPGGSRTILDVSAELPLSIDLRDLRIVADVAIDAADRDRPRLRRISISPQFTIDLEGFLPVAGLRADQFTIDAGPGGEYRLQMWLSDLLLTGLPAEVRGPHLDARLIVTIAPELRIEIDGVLRVKLPEVDLVSMPFAKFSVGTGLQTPPGLLHLIGLPTNIPGTLPRDWPSAWPPAGGLAPDMKLEPPGATPGRLEHAAALEDAMQIALPHGEVYEVALAADAAPAGPSLPIGRRPPPTPGTPAAPRVHFVYKTFDDTALWTGYLLAAEAFRIAAATTPEERQAAIAAASNVITGIEHLFDVTQTPGLPARAALPRRSPISADPPFDRPPADIADRYYGPVTIDGQAWYGFGRGSHPTSRDSFAGLLFGLTTALDLAGDAALQATARDMLASVVTFLVGHHFTVPTPVRGSPSTGGARPGTTLPPPAPRTRILTHFLGAIEYQLMVLRVAKTLATAGHPGLVVNHAAALYDDLAPAGALMWPSLWMSSFDPVQQYYKFNLEHAVLGVLLMLEDDPALREGYARSFRMLRRSTGHHRNAFFNLVNVLVAPASERASLQSAYDASVTLADEIRSELWEWQLRHEAVAGAHGLPSEATPDTAYLTRLYPEHTHEYTPMPGWDAGVSQKDPFLASDFALPVHKRPGSGVDFVWQRAPFATSVALRAVRDPSMDPSGPPGGPAGAPSGFPPVMAPFADAGNRALEAAGVDYLLPVYMAKYLGVI